MLARIARWALAPLALATAFTTVIAPPSGAVTGPNIAKDFEHPYVGLVAFYDQDNVFLHRCTGTLLSSQVFLTAGHCVAADDAGNVAPLARIWFEQDAGADYDPVTGEIRSIVRVPAGYGKVAVLDALQAELEVAANRIVYVGDGGSDVHVMLHVNRRDGFTVAVSETKHLNQIARRTVLSDDALCVLVPILEEIIGLPALEIRTFFEGHGLLIQEWDKVRTDWLTIGPPGPPRTLEA